MSSELDIQRSDFCVVASDTLRFDVGQTSRTFTVPVFGDAAMEGDETVNLTLSDPVNAALGMPYEAILMIVDNVLYLPLVARNCAP